LNVLYIFISLSIIASQHGDYRYAVFDNHLSLCLTVRPSNDDIIIISKPSYDSSNIIHQLLGY